jgi:hypothetical protein
MDHIEWFMSIMRPNAMTARKESVALITVINKSIRNKGYYLLTDRSLKLIFSHASELKLKLKRLRTFAKLHHWQVKIHEPGHSTVLFSPHHHPHAMILRSE